MPCLYALASPQVVAERMAKQGNKTPKQLYVDMRMKKTKKVATPIPNPLACHVPTALWQNTGE